jgi:hypothetical protein
MGNAKNRKGELTAALLKLKIWMLALLWLPFSTLWVLKYKPLSILMVLQKGTTFLVTSQKFSIQLVNPALVQTGKTHTDSGTTC